MKFNFKTILFWSVSLILMLSAYMYQKITGPTYPVKGYITVNNKEYKYKLPRTSDEDEFQKVELNIPDKSVTATFIWQKYLSYDSLTYQKMERQGDKLIAKIPHQQPAGKVQYDIVLQTNDGNEIKLTDEPVILRYKGKVPNLILLPHILFMFFAFWLSVRTGMEAVAKRDNLYKLTLWTTVLLAIGGIILGPIVQKYAFDAYWTGWPFGHDLTDNKLFAALVMWAIALWKIYKNRNDRKWAIIAAVVTLAVFIVPHSLFGSEIDYTKIHKP